MCFEKIFRNKPLLKCLLCLFVCVFSAMTVVAQNLTVRGKILDSDGNFLAGVAVVLKGSTKGVTSSESGDYVIVDVPKGGKLEFSLVSYVTSEKEITGDVMNVVLIESSESLEEVTVVAFAKQKKESVIASVSTVSAKELKVPSSNLTTALAGRIAGLISYQRTGEPGKDNAEFFIRGVTTFGTGKANPLILIDGVEMSADDLARLTADDMSSFSIMKDANATALYGARGANGVILVTTKEGRQGKVTVNFRAETSLSMPVETMKYADPVTYMRLHNEAAHTRNPQARNYYSMDKIYHTERGDDPVYYPANIWQDLLFDTHTFNHRYNMSVSGGGTVARYYVSAAYSKDNGIIRMDKRQNFNNNIDINRYVLRSNVNVDITKTTEVIVRLSGAFDDYSGPLDGGTDLYNKALNANPVYFRPYYEPDESHAHMKYILFGNYGDGKYLNPYAEMLKGYKSNDRSNMSAQFEARQDLKFITEGLSVRGLFNVDRYSSLDMLNSYKPYFFSLVPKSGSVYDRYMLTPLNPTGGTDYLQATPGEKSISLSMYMEAAVQYNRVFADRHSVSGLLVYTLRESKDGNASNLEGALPYRNLGLAGRVTYSYDSRYFIEGNFGYNGSERFARNERYGFFPSIGAGYIISNETFMEPFKKTVSKLKLKATYGLVGNDDIGSSRFFYLADVNMNDGNYGYTFGTNFTGTGNGISIKRYSDPFITWEISRKTNIGMELNLWNSLELQVDWFHESRSKILMKRAHVPAQMGLQGDPPQSNVGEAKGSGIDMSVDYNKSFSNDFWTVFRGNFTYAASQYGVYEEPSYPDAPWRRHEGRKLSQEWGYVAERLFLDDNEVRNSPKQFGNYMAGDIKYKDINGDMVIDENDQVPIGFPTTPEINYGFGVSLGWKNLDFSCFFQGSARSSFWIDASATAPFVGGAVEGFTTNRAMLQYYVDSHWSEDSRDIFALWPRLSETVVENNKERSTWFMRDGSFLRLKTAELGYSLPKELTAKLKLQRVRLYVSGSNLLRFSKFKMWDPEMAGNGLAYPIQRIYNIGLNVEF
jgi:TonB-linked SusC/RagA family outer membrane protein